MYNLRVIRGKDLKKIDFPTKFEDFDEQDERTEEESNATLKEFQRSTGESHEHEALIDDGDLDFPTKFQDFDEQDERTEEEMDAMVKEFQRFIVESHEHEALIGNDGDSDFPKIFEDSDEEDTRTEEEIDLIFKEFQKSIGESHQHEGIFDHRNPTEILIDHLREIQDVDITKITKRSAIVDKMGDVLSLIFRIGTNCENFKDEQKKEIGTLLVKAIEPIKLHVDEATFLYSSLNPFLLQIRSALQFLIECYANFPTGSTTLSNIFKQAKLQEEINIFDGKLRIFQQCISRDDGDWDFKFFRGDSLPETHNWWPKENPFKVVAFMNDSENPFYFAYSSGK